MRKAAVLGHFAFGIEKANGQTIKTKILGNALREEIGKEQVDYYDTMGGAKFLLKLPFVLLGILRSHRNIIFLPAQRGLLVILPLLVIINTLFHRKLHYVVIGGWLSVYFDRHPVVKRFAKRINRIYVETHNMVEELQTEGFTNVILMPNFKPLHILEDTEVQPVTSTPLPLCTFSRVMKEKGIEDAVNAIRKCNGTLGYTAFRLDIYGSIEEGEEQWFKQLMSQQPKEINYCGVVPFNRSSEVLKDYFALLFPTLFRTEGFAGTLIDAMSAGVPPIASDCPSNKEIISDRHTGLLYKQGDADRLAETLILCAKSPSIINNMRYSCLKTAKSYLPEIVIKTLSKELI
jgi:Glycosyltransferase